MILIAAADAHWGIGKEGKLLASIPADMRFFKETTMGHVVVMGRKTLESFPGGRPLKNRVNIVLTGDASYEKEGTVIVHSIRELQAVLKSYAEEPIYCIGGASVYQQLLPYCDKALITRIDAVFEADAYLPDLDADPDWEETKRSVRQEHEGLRYCFCEFERRRTS